MQRDNQLLGTRPHKSECRETKNRLWGKMDLPRYLNYCGVTISPLDWICSRAGNSFSHFSYEDFLKDRELQEHFNRKVATKGVIPLVCPGFQKVKETSEKVTGLTKDGHRFIVYKDNPGIFNFCFEEIVSSIRKGRISKDFSRAIANLMPEQVLTAHLIYQEIVESKKDTFTLKELTMAINPGQKATGELRKRAEANLRDLAKTGLFKIFSVENNWTIKIPRDLLEGINIDGGFQLFEKGFVEDFKRIFKKTTGKRCYRFEVGAALGLVHYFLPNQHLRFFSDGAKHRIYFKELINRGHFTKRLVRRNDFKKMRGLMINRVKVLEAMGLIQKVEFEGLGNGNSGRICWENRATKRLQTTKNKLKAA